MTWPVIVLLGIPVTCAAALLWLLRARPGASLDDAAAALAKAMTPLTTFTSQGKRRAARATARRRAQ